MKRFLALTIMMVLVLSATVASAADYSSMTVDQLKKELNLIQNELVVRGLKAENKKVIVDQDGIQIYINGDITIEKMYSWDDVIYLSIPVIVVNNTTYAINTYIENASVNGWSSEDSDDITTVPAGKKAKGKFYFDLSDAEIYSIEEFEDVEFCICVYDDEAWKTMFTTKPITLVP